MRSLQKLMPVVKPFRSIAGELLVAENTLQSHFGKLNDMSKVAARDGVGAVDKSAFIFSSTKAALGLGTAAKTAEWGLNKGLEGAEFTKTQFIDPVSSAMNTAMNTAVENYKKSDYEPTF